MNITNDNNFKDPLRLKMRNYAILILLCNSKGKENKYLRKIHSSIKKKLRLNFPFFLILHGVKTCR